MLPSRWFAHFAVLLALTLLALLITLTPSASVTAQSQPDALGSLSGTVRNAEGEPLSNILVSLFQYPYNPPLRTDTTDAQGNYHLLSIPPGSYKVKFEDKGKVYATTHYVNSADWQDADVVNISGQEVTGIDAALSPGGSISVTVQPTLTQSSDTLYLNLYRKMAPDRWEFYDSLFWPTDSELLFAGLPSGTYRLCADRYNNINYYGWSECYDNALPSYFGVIVADATDIVINGAENKVIAMQFGDLNQIQGTVRSETGKPLTNVYVTAIHESGFEAGYASTNANGFFVFPRISDGTYFLKATHNFGEYIPTFYENATSQADATPLQVGASSRHSVTIVMQNGGVIRGRIFVEGGGIPANASIVAYVPLEDGTWSDFNTTCNFGPCGYSYSPVTGAYTITGLATGTYRVGATEWFNNDRQIFAFYGGHDLQAANDVAVTFGQTTQDIDIQLGAGRFNGSITGAALANGVPQAGIDVGLYYNGTYLGLPFVATTTDAQGNYRFDGLYAAHYNVGFHDPQGDYATAFYGSNIITPTRVIITGAMTVANVNVALTPGSTIRGRVTRGSGKSKEDVQLLVRLENSYLIYPFTDVRTDAAGNYEITGLSPGKYLIGALNPECCITGPPIAYYPYGKDDLGAELIEVGEGVIISGIDIPFDQVPRAYLPMIGDNNAAAE